MKYHPAQEPDPRFPVEVQHLRPATVEFDSGLTVPIPGLTAEEFEITTTEENQ